MKERLESKMQPSVLRLLLAISMVLTAGITIAGFVMVQKQLSEYAVEVSHKKVDAAASNQSLKTLQTLEKELAKNQDIITKASTLKLTSDLPQFKAIEDIQNHATANKLAIKDITFAAASTGTPAAATAPTAPQPVVAIPETQADGVDITFTLSDGQDDGAVNINDFLNFLYDIEHSIPKMQIQGIDVSGKGSTRIAVQPMTVKMFVK